MGTFSARLAWSENTPLAVVGLNGSDFVGRASVPLVQLFTANEQRARTSQAYFRSAVGDRLRVIDVLESDDTSSPRVAIVQRDDLTGIVTTTTIRCLENAATYSFETTVTNTSSRPVTITALSSLTLGFGQSER